MVFIKKYEVTINEVRNDIDNVNDTVNAFVNDYVNTNIDDIMCAITTANATVNANNRDSNRKAVMVDEADAVDDKEGMLFDIAWFSDGDDKEL